MIHKIKVTQDHINYGVKLVLCSCPIALALKEHFHREVSVGTSSFRFLVPNYDEYKVFALPTEAYNFIINYDAGKTVKPFTFKVDV